MSNYHPITRKSKKLRVLGAPAPKRVCFNGGYSGETIKCSGDLIAIIR
jgi:hypothetical protein